MKALQMHSAAPGPRRRQRHPVPPIVHSFAAQPRHGGQLNEPGKGTREGEGEGTPGTGHQAGNTCQDTRAVRSSAARTTAGIVTIRPRAPALVTMRYYCVRPHGMGCILGRAMLHRGRGLMLGDTDGRERTSGDFRVGYRHK